MSIMKKSKKKSLFKSNELTEDEENTYQKKWDSPNGGW